MGIKLAAVRIPGKGGEFFFLRRLVELRRGGGAQFFPLVAFFQGHQPPAVILPDMVSPFMEQ
jgi:hypothetical protein